MKQILFIVTALFAFVAATSSAQAAVTGNANGNKIQCFDGTTDGGYNGVCTLLPPGSARLNTIDADANPNNNYAGVYLQNTNLDGKALSDVNKLAFSYEGTGATGGSPRISLPIDENGDGTTEAYAFADTLGCNNGDANTGTLDMIGDETCTIAYGANLYTNWADFATTNPSYRVAKDALGFIIVDQPGDFTVSNVQLGKGPAKTVK